MIKAYAAMQAGGEFQAYEYDPGELKAGEVDITVEHCGICHSDLSMHLNEWGGTTYPFVPGHEVIGTVGALGDGVSGLSVGDRVGLGWQSGFCMSCGECMTGNHNLCGSVQGTILGRHGGFADRVRAEAASLVKLPENLDPQKAGPLFCAGITVFNPLVQFDIQPTDRVGVIGIGGLGHLALQFCNAWGCEVTAFTSSESKAEEARALGAHHVLDSRDRGALKGARRSLDMIICTVSASLNWNDYIMTLKPKGRLHFVGAVTEPLAVSVFAMMPGQISVSSSPVGSPSTIGQMLDFCARHDISAQTEHYDFKDVNAAMARLESGDARYRVVLSHS